MTFAGPARIAALALVAVACVDQPKVPPPPKIVRLPDVSIARVALAEAPVQVDRGTGTYDEVQIGEELRSGDHVRTGPDGFARVDFSSGGGVRLLDAAEVELKSMGRTGKMRLVPSVTVLFGSVRGFLDPPAPNAPDRPRLYFRANAAPIVVEARGDAPLQTRTTRNRDGLEVAVVQGEGAVILNGLERVLKPGQFVDVVAGEVREARELPPPPEVVEPTGDERFFCPGLVVRLSWKPPPVATASLVQVASDPLFQELSFTAEVGGDHALFVPRAPRRYYWRTATRDADGRAGEYGEAHVLFCEATPPEDLLSTPAEGAVIRYFGQTPKLYFGWKAVAGAQTYRLVVTKGAQLHGADALVREVHGTGVEIEDVPEGEYVWGVYAEDLGDLPLFLAPRRLVLSQSRVQTPSTLQQWGQ